MKFYFDDHLYSKQEITQIRNTVRVLLLDEQEEFLFLHIKGQDDFGVRDHFETVGGGVEEQETLEKAVYREIEEETGYQIIGSIEELCIIEDVYYLIQRRTISHFFVVHVRRREVGQSHPTPEEEKLFHGITWIPKDNVEEMLAVSKQIGSIGELIHRRDLCAFREYIKKQQ